MNAPHIIWSHILFSVFYFCTTNDILIASSEKMSLLQWLKQWNIKCAWQLCSDETRQGEGVWIWSRAELAAEATALRSSMKKACRSLPRRQAADPIHIDRSSWMRSPAVASSRVRSQKLRRETLDMQYRNTEVKKKHWTPQEVNKLGSHCLSGWKLASAGSFVVEFNVQGSKSPKKCFNKLEYYCRQLALLKSYETKIIRSELRCKCNKLFTITQSFHLQFQALKPEIYFTLIQ